MREASKTAYRKFTQLCPEQAHIDFMPVADTWRAVVPHRGLSQMYVHYVYRGSIILHMCTFLYTHNWRLFERGKSARSAG